MAYKHQAGGYDIYDYPVELVWRALTDSSTSNLIDPLDEAEYEKEPRPGAIYTRALERVVNERFSFEIKTNLYVTRWYVELTPQGPCETKVSVREEVEFSNFKSFMLCRMGIGLGGEVRHFLRDLDSKMRNFERKLKLK